MVNMGGWNNLRVESFFSSLYYLIFFFEGQLSIPWEPLTCCVFQSHSEHWTDSKLRRQCFFFFFLTLHKLFCWDSSNKSHSHSTEQWLQCHCLLSLNLTWCDVSKMVACPVTQWALLLLKALQRFIFLSTSVLPECRYRWWLSRTSTGSHLHSWLFVGETFVFIICL